MQAYWFNRNDATIAVAKPNQTPTSHKDFTKIPHYAPIPEDMFKYYASEAWVRARRKPTTWMIADFYTVTEDVKGVIEALEPSIHQFIPITIKCGRKDDYASYNYFSLRINQRVDDVLVEKSDVRWSQLELQDGRVVSFWNKKEEPIVLPRQSIEGKHLWWNTLSSNLMMMSGTLHDRLAERALTQGLRFQQQIVD